MKYSCQKQAIKTGFQFTENKEAEDWVKKNHKEIIRQSQNIKQSTT